MDWPKVYIFTGVFVLFGVAPEWVGQASSLVSGNPPQQPAAQSVAFPLTHKLGAFLESGKTGIEMEWAQEPHLVAEMKSQAQGYRDYRRGKMKAAAKAEFLASCLVRPKSNPYCSFVVEEKRFDKEFEDSLELPVEDVAVLNAKQLEKVIVSGRLTSEILGTVKPRIFRRVLRKMSGLGPIGGLASTLLKGSCPRVEMINALAFKVEGNFPEKEYRDIALSLYERAASCGSKASTSANLARFRGALLQIWAGSCSKALPLLESLEQDPSKRFESRSLYWRARCAVQDGDKLEAALLRNRMLRVNPLSYHSIALHQGFDYPISSLLYSKEPHVQLRAIERPEINPLLRAVEALILIDEHRLARRALRVISDHLEGATAEFQLYVAVLFGKSHDRIQKFRTLSSLFLRSGEMITRETLRLFYPVENLKILRLHQKRVDPYLVLSLIRQESAFNPYARSSAGALGLMQLMPATARSIARVSRRSLLRPKVNIRLGTRYFDKMLKRFGGDAELALASYNAGPHNVDRWLKRYPVEDRMLFLDLIPFSETRKYVSLIGRNYFWYLNLYAPETFYLQDSQSPKGRSIASIKRVHFKAFQFF